MSPAPRRIYFILFLLVTGQVSNDPLVVSRYGQKCRSFHKSLRWYTAQQRYTVTICTLRRVSKTYFVPCLHKHLGTGKWIFNATFCMCISRSSSRADTFVVAVLHSKRKHVRSSYSLYSKRLTCSQSLVPARGIAYTNITHIVIPLSLCKFTLFSKSEDHLFLQPVHLRSTRTIITQRVRYFKQRKLHQRGLLLWKENSWTFNEDFCYTKLSSTSKCMIQWRSKRYEIAYMY